MVCRGPGGSAWSRSDWATGLLFNLGTEDLPSYYVILTSHGTSSSTDEELLPNTDFRIANGIGEPRAQVDLVFHYDDPSRWNKDYAFLAVDGSQLTDEEKQLAWTTSDIVQPNSPSGLIYAFRHGRPTVTTLSIVRREQYADASDYDRNLLAQMGLSRAAIDPNSSKDLDQRGVSGGWIFPSDGSNPVGIVVASVWLRHSLTRQIRDLAKSFRTDQVFTLAVDHLDTRAADPLTESDATAQQRLLTNVNAMERLLRHIENGRLGEYDTQALASAVRSFRANSRMTVREARDYVDETKAALEELARDYAARLLEEAPELGFIPGSEIIPDAERVGQ